MSPEIKIPLLNHPFIDGFSMINHPFLGYPMISPPMYMESP
jgi:hypothetical protein